MDPSRFDTLIRSLTDARSRRGALATLLGGTFGLGGLTDTAAKQGKNGNGGGKNKKDGNGKKNGKGNRKNGKGNDKKNGNDNRNGNGTGNGAGTGNGNDIPPRCGEETCARELPEDQFVACAEKCGRCRIQEQFCVIGPDAEHPVNHATCCFEHQQCCQDSLACCDKTETCCNGRCCPEGWTCCNDTCCRTDNPWTACCDGQCLNTEVAQAHCGACGNACLAGQVCRFGHCECFDTDDCDDDECPGGTELCSGRCVNTYTDPTNCGSCGNPCGPDELCVEGGCVPVCRDQNCPQGQRCFNGNRHTCSGQASIDCICSCGGLNYCPQPEGTMACQSNPC